MKFLLIIIIMLTSTIFADDFDLDNSKLNKEENIIKNNKKPIDTQKINDITNNIINNIINFQNMLPKITGKIVSLPKAGTIGIKFDKDKIRIHEGLKLIAKRTGIDKPLVGDGIIYLKYNHYNQLVGKYTRSQVGKFDISDKVNSKWYKPVFIVGNITDNIGNNQESIKALKDTLFNSIKNNKKIKTKNNKKIKMILNKISTLSNYQKEMKRLFGLGVDYVLLGDFIKEDKVLTISIISTYTNKSIFDFKIDINL